MEKVGLEQSIFLLVKKVSRLSHKIEKHQASARTYGTDDLLYMREAHFLSALDREGTDMGTIARRMYITNGAVSQIAARLEKKGYIHREKSPEDSRIVICVPTDGARKVKQYHDRLDRRNFSTLYHMMDGFTVEDIELCHRFIETMEEFYSLPVSVEDEA